MPVIISVLKNKKILAFILTIAFSFVCETVHAKTFSEFYFEHFKDLQKVESMSGEEYRAFALEFKTLTASFFDGEYFDFAKNQQTENEYICAAQQCACMTVQNFLTKKT